MTTEAKRVWYKFMAQLGPVRGDQIIADLEAFKTPPAVEELDLLYQHGLFLPIDDERGVFVVPF